MQMENEKFSRSSHDGFLYVDFYLFFGRRGDKEMWMKTRAMQIIQDSEIL